MRSIAVLDYGMSNLRSVAAALQRVCGDPDQVQVIDRPDEIRKAERIVFPGNGAIRQCMANLAKLGLEEIVSECVRSKPYLGICLGAQSLMESSAEDGGTPCLGLLPGVVSRLTSNPADASENRWKVPHIGWNRVLPRGNHPLWRGIDPNEWFYFMHSFYVVPSRSDDVAAVTQHAVEFASAVARDNVFAVQFHPEKSQRAGLQLLRNFTEWRP